MNALEHWHVLTALPDSADYMTRPEFSWPMGEQEAREEVAGALDLLVSSPTFGAEAREVGERWLLDERMTRAVLGHSVEASAAFAVVACRRTTREGCLRVANVETEAVMEELAERTGVPVLGQTFEQHELIVDAVGGKHMLDQRRAYSRPLPEDLRLWHHYTLDGGHSILVALKDHYQPGADPRGYMVSAPVKAVLRGWSVTEEGYVLCDLPYSPDTGLVTDPADAEH